ncbi:putative disease resistance protein [Prunus yedoensis var. nudiflora]|uniref:Putative disease resistance protein n=1 Tax=Prunus yedoensis var. nudiflora TaxID=2094558 RepID=A0A314U9T3_PRUYE|nr:putative disease resistance protein [Prunus yedoensis var. nudiflora]
MEACISITQGNVIPPLIMSYLIKASLTFICNFSDRMSTVDATQIAQAAGPAVQPLEHFFLWIGRYLKRKWGYVNNLGENFKQLEIEEGRLLNKEVDARREIERNVGRLPTQECNTWLDNIREKKKEIEDLKKRHQSINNNKCLTGLCALSSLLRLGKDIAKEPNKIRVLKDEITLGHLTESPPPAQYVRKHATRIDDFQTLIKSVKEAQDLLEDDEIKCIRILGLPGVGKTTVMENLHDKVIVTNRFKDMRIFWVTLTVKDCVEEIQQELSKQLGLKVEENSSNQSRAASISKELERKGCLLFLDQVVSEIDLRKVGIYDDHSNVKVVFACSSKNSGRICGLTRIEEVKIRALQQDEAQKMFNKQVNVDIMRDPEINDTAALLVRECGGMPVLINVIARKLEDETDPAVWRATLSQLQAPSSQLNEELEEFSRFFQLVYNTLKDTDKPFLLYWEIFPVGYEIHRDYIIECWRTEHLFTQNRRLWEIRDSGHRILTEFLRTGVVERGTKSRHYKMFELFQRIMRRTANRNRGSHEVLVKEACERIEEKEWSNAEKISLISHGLSTLPEDPQCSAILTLLLQENQNLRRIPESFFTCMEKLRLLDLHGTRITSLPPCISSLRNLRSLYLNNCEELEELPSEIGQLQSLEIFDLSGTGILGFLHKIEELTNLKCLRISFEKNVSSHNHVQGQLRDIVPLNKFSGLASLEELSIDVDHYNRKWNHIVDVIVEQVNELKKLTALYLYFPKVDSLKTFVSGSKSWNSENRQGDKTPGSCFRSFNISVGCYHQTNNCSSFDMLECSAEKHLRFCAGEEIPDSILQVLKQARTFELIGHQNAPNLSVFKTDNLRGLQICKVEECKEMNSIIHGGVTERVAFECLEKLYIINIPKLVHIWEGSKQHESLPQLKTLILKRCPMLKILFSRESGITQELPKLQCLEVEDCPELEEIIETGSDVRPLALPQLKNIELRNLPKLLTISKVAQMVWPSLETMEIKTCEMLKDLPATMQNAVKLRMITCTVDWKNGLVWPSQKVEQLFQNRFLYIV